MACRKVLHCPFFIYRLLWQLMKIVRPKIGAGTLYALALKQCLIAASKILLQEKIMLICICAYAAFSGVVVRNRVGVQPSRSEVRRHRL